MASTIEKVKHALHLDKNHSENTATGTTHTTHSTHNNGVPEGTAGRHSSRVANAADPRVDSDLDSSRHTGTHTGTHTHTGTTHTGTTHNNGVPEGTAGPHSSRIANAADPRVDSDLDSSRHTGATGYGNTGSTGYGSTGTGVGSHTGATHNTTTTSGPHGSNLLNKLDPRVDSDNDGSRNAGAAQNGAGGASTTGTGYTSGTNAGNHGVSGSTGYQSGVSHSTNAGPHDSNIANKVDPRVDSDLDGRGNRHGATTGGVFGASGSHATAGSGTAQNTAGPHNSDLANKLDPRVDSDRDGSKTYGGNATHN